VRSARGLFIEPGEWSRGFAGHTRWYRPGLVSGYSAARNLPPAPATLQTPSSAAAGLVLPRTYQPSCLDLNSCQAGDAGVVPSTLNRPLRLPRVARGESCPTSAGSAIDTAHFHGTTLGSGAVRPLIAMTGDLRHGVTNAAHQTLPRGWLAFKTLWFSAPKYRGPYAIRAERLDGAGSIEFGGQPKLGPLVVPPGPTPNSFDDGYRTVPGQTWVRTAGCYGWQIDGLTFSTVMVVKVNALP